MGQVTRDIEVEDTGVLNVKWRNGALGSMSVTMLTYPQNLEGSITILGDKGTVKIGGTAVNEIQTWKFEDRRDYDSQVEAANYQTTSVYGFGHPLYYKNVVDVMRGRAKPETDGREGLKSLELLVAAYMSARDGQTVGLCDEENFRPHFSNRFYCLSITSNGDTFLRSTYDFTWSGALLVRPSRTEKCDF